MRSRCRFTKAILAVVFSFIFSVSHASLALARKSKAELEVTDSYIGLHNPPQTLVVKSKVLGEDRRIYVQVPEGYSRGEDHYPVFYVLDGEWLFHLASASARFYSYDEVTDISMPRTIVIGIENTDRDRDYVPTTNSGTELVFETAGEAGVFLDFLETELIPLIDKRYRTKPFRTLAGWSFSGLFSTWTAVERPELFNAYLCISPAVWWDNDLIFERMKSARFGSPARFVFTLGKGEEGTWVDVSTRRLLDRLQSEPIANTSVEFIEFEDVGHSWGIAPAMNKGLQAVFAEYIAPEDVRSGGLSAVTQYYDDLSERWGYTVNPPGSVFVKMAWEIWGREEKNVAIDILLGAASIHPLDSSVLYYLGYMLDKTGQYERALEYVEAALLAELGKDVPSGVNTRAYSSKIATIKQELTN